MSSQIIVQSVVNAPIEKVWECWNKPEHITKWAFASDDWEAPVAENDVRTGGKFMTRMQAKDGSAGFDFGGIYTNVREHELIEYDMSDPVVDPTDHYRASPRHVKIIFEEVPGGTKITETFDPETENPIEMQRAGWQAILDNFKKYVEGRRKAGVSR